MKLSTNILNSIEELRYLIKLEKVDGEKEVTKDVIAANRLNV